MALSWRSLFKGQAALTLKSGNTKVEVSLYH
jgi:hypothetical protein